MYRRLFAGAISSYSSALLCHPPTTWRWRYDRPALKLPQTERFYLQPHLNPHTRSESAGYDWENYLSQCRYENEVLKLDEVLPVHKTSFTSSDNDGAGNPGKDLKDKKDSSVKSDGNKGNDSPSPSDDG